MTGLICKIKDWAYELQEMSYPENFLEFQENIACRRVSWSSREGRSYKMSTEQNDSIHQKQQKTLANSRKLFPAEHRMLPLADNPLFSMLPVGPSLRALLPADLDLDNRGIVLYLYITNFNVYQYLQKMSYLSKHPKQWQLLVILNSFDLWFFCKCSYGPCFSAV